MVELSPSFGEHVRTHEPWTALRLFLPYLLVYFGAITAAVVLLRRRAELRLVGPSVLVALAFVAAVVLFEVTVLYFRYLPHGSGVERHGAARDDFIAAASAALLALYAATLAAAALIGRMIGGRRGAYRVAAIVAGFLVASFPPVEFMNACDIGRPLLLDRAVRC